VSNFAGSNFYQSMLRLSETVQLAEDQRLSLTTSGAAGFTTQEAAILSDGIPFDTFDQQAWLSAEGGTRAAFASALTSFGGEFSACLAELAKVINPTGTSTGGVPATAPKDVLPQLYLFMANAAAAPNTAGFASPPLVNSRNLTRGSPSAGGSNVGTGTLYRLNVDRFGYPLEGGFAETVTYLCTADNQTGTLPGQEQFTVSGQPFRDALTWFAPGYGSGLALPAGVSGVTGDTTTALIQNPSFSQASGTNFTSLVLNGWTQTSGLATALGLDTTNFYRACALEGATPASLEAQSSFAITQQIAPNNTAGQLALTAYLSRLAWDGSLGTWSGSMTVAVGSKSWSASSGASGWQVLLPTLDKNLWAQNFEQAGLAVTITVTIASGTWRGDDFCWSPFTNVGGSLVWAGGGRTNWIVNDTFAVVDSEPSPPSKTQNWLRLSFPQFFLPSAVLPAAPVTAATLATGSSGATVTAGAHVGYVTFVNATAESALGPASAIYVSDGAHHIAWSSIPTGPGGTTKRGLYRTKANSVGVAGTPYLVAYINDNSTTTFDDSVADASLLYLSASVADPTN
jgi:hypothetical protein